jgi:hypothetical protein
VEANVDAQDCGALTEVRAKRLEREQAVDLRKMGLSYSEIRAKVPVSQASLSLWLRGIELEACHQAKLAKKKEAGQRQAAEKVHQLKLARIKRTLSLAEFEANQLLNSKELLWVIGTVLYWAEGTKIKEWKSWERTTFTNMDPSMIRIVREWLVRYCSLTRDDFVYALYIHPDADVTAAQGYWAYSLGISDKRLHTYYKRHNPSPHRKHVGRTYYGTMRMSVRRSTLLTHRIMGWIRAVVTHCGVV